MEFSRATRAWFDAAFAAPTPAQTRGWEAIGRGEHTLILAPTGSGKTLAAFLWALDRLMSGSAPAERSLAEPGPTEPGPTEPGPTEPGPRRRAGNRGVAKTCRVLYVSPLKALTYDVERNLRAPLAGIAREAARMGIEVPEVRVATRTGDTPAEDRRAMTKQVPDILITTPESLYLLLTSQAGSILSGVEHVIVDEVHALAGTKRGAHLALSLERLEALCGREIQRIGLSATQRPLEEIARFLGGTERKVTIIDAGVRKPLELSIVVPVEDMGELGKPIFAAGGGGAGGGGAGGGGAGGGGAGHGGAAGGVGADAGADDEALVMRGPAAGDPEVRASIWPAIYPRLLELIRRHRSTLIFVNSRRLAERLAARLNDLAGEELVRAHHGSIAREQRLEIEDALKAGRLPALVATSSLELGIDMGAIDLVVQVEAPTSVASGLQRIGRAGHRVGEASKGRIFPKFRHDLLVASVVANRMHAGLIEETAVVHNPLDVLAQQLVATAAAAEGPVPVDALEALVRRAYCFSDLPRNAFEAVLDMLSGRYPSDEFAELRPRLVWDRVAGTITARPGAKMLAVTSGGTIPDRGLYGVFTPEGARVGELDEEMVYESRVGETFLLGATTWRIEDITRDRVLVTPAPGVPGKMPFWHGDSLGRPYELGVAVGQFTRALAGASPPSDQDLAGDYDLDRLAVANLRSYLAEELESTGGLVPTDRQVVVERFRDELGDWRVALLSPFGAGVHAPWAMAIEARLAEQDGRDAQAVWSDDGIIVRLPDADDAPSLDVVMIGPEEVEELVVAGVGRSALFSARFRENAARSLLLARRRPGTRTPLWQLRQRAADLLSAASKYESFPILLETYRECLRDVFDLPALVALLGDISARRVRVASVDLASPSPFASGLASAYVAQFMYEGDAPLAERRAQALTLDRRMLSELLGSDELRELLDAGALDRLEAEMQSLDPERAATSLEGVADLLLRLGDLSLAELAARSSQALAAKAWVELVGSRRAVVLRCCGEERLVAAEDAARYRDALGAALPSGLPEALLRPVADALVQLVRRWARTHGPFGPAEISRRFGVAPTAVRGVLDALVAEGRLERGQYRPGGSGDEWVDVDVLRVLRQRSLAALRREVEPVDAGSLASFLPAWQGVALLGAEPAAGGLDRLYEVVGQLQGYALPASVLESDVLAARVRGYSPRLLDELLASGEVMWVGAGSLGRDDGRVMLAFRDQAPLLLGRLGIGVPSGGVPSGGVPSGGVPPGSAGSPGSGDSFDPGLDRPPQPDRLHQHLRDTLLARGACFFRELAAPGANDIEILEALWDLVWAGEVTCDSFGAVRAFTGVSSGRPGPRRRGSGGHRGSAGPYLARPRPRLGSLGALGPPKGQGRWSLVGREVGWVTPSATGAEVLLAGVLLERHGVLTREAVRGEGLPGGFSGLYPVLRAMEEAGRVRRGYFLAGMGAAQFALPGAVDRLRAERSGAERSGAERSGAGRVDAGTERHAGREAFGRIEVVILAATDPANPLGLCLPWPQRGPARVAGSYVVLVGGVPSVYVERGGRGLVALRDCDGTWEESGMAALAELVTSRRWGRLALRRFPEGLEPALKGAGFVPTPKGLVRYA